MRIVLIIFLWLYIPRTSSAQIEYGSGFILGGANYSGDLSGAKISPTIAQMLPAFGVLLDIQPVNGIRLRMQIAYAQVQGADRFSNKIWQKERNLDFKTGIIEGAIISELHLLKWIPATAEWISSPYIFGGIALFNFNPRTKYKGDWIYLQPLGTEGQGLSEYPNKRPYEKTTFSFPMGAGLEININETVSVALELGWRWTLTDYLDDLSGTYADYDVLKNGNGDLAALLAYRKHELSGVIEPYPFKEGAIRGNPDVNDIYAMGMLKIVYHWNRKFSHVFKNNSNRRRKAQKCPSF